MEVNALEARLHRQDMQIEQLLTDVDNLTEQFIEFRARNDVNRADDNDIVNRVLRSIGDKFYEMTGIYG